MLRMCLFLCLMLLSQPAYAAVSPAWKEYKVFSGDLAASFRAEIACTENCDAAYNEQVYHLTVRNSVTKEVAWSCVYDYRGDIGGVLSDDGWVFVDVDPWYHGAEVPVVHIYRKGTKTFELTPRYLGIDPPSVGRGSNTASSWLKSYHFARNSRIPVLEIVTIDGNSIRINCLDGYPLGR
jgi:hypothetical protein